MGGHSGGSWRRGPVCDRVDAIIVKFNGRLGFFKIKYDYRVEVWCYEKNAKEPFDKNQTLWRYYGELFDWESNEFGNLIKQCKGNFKSHIVTFKNLNNAQEFIDILDSKMVMKKLSE